MKINIYCSKRRKNPQHCNEEVCEQNTKRNSLFYLLLWFGFLFRFRGFLMPLWCRLGGCHGPEQIIVFLVCKQVCLRHSWFLRCWGSCQKKKRKNDCTNLSMKEKDLLFFFKHTFWCNVLLHSSCFGGLYTITPYSHQDSSLVDSWSKGCEFEPWQKRQENFFPQGQLCVLTLFLCLFYPHVTTVARKSSQSFCQKRRWQVTSKHAHTFDPMKSEWADYAAFQAKCGNLSENELTQLVREHSATVISARWAIVDWSWPEDWN